MGFGSVGMSKLEYARRIAGTLGQLALQQGDAVGLSCVAGGIVRNIPPKRNPSHLMTIFDVLEQTAAAGPDPARAGAARAGRDDRQRALVIIISDLFVEPRALRSVFSTCGFGTMMRRSFICWIRESWPLNFAGRCGFSTWRGGRRSSPSPTRSPTAITRH